MIVYEDNINEPGLSSTEMDCVFNYHGKKEKLIGTGLFKRDWFPGENGNKKTIHLVPGEELHSAGHALYIDYAYIDRHDSKCETFDINLFFTTEEFHRRQNVGLIPIRKAKAMELALGWINGLPQSPEDFKKRGAKYITDILSTVSDGMVAKRGGYFLKQDTIDDFNKAFEVAKQILINGATGFNAEVHKQQRLQHSREAFDRHLAISFLESEIEAEFKKFNSEVESELSRAALNGCELTEKIAA